MGGRRHHEEQDKSCAEGICFVREQVAWVFATANCMFGVNNSNRTALPPLRGKAGFLAKAAFRLKTAGKATSPPRTKRASLQRLPAG